MCSVRDSPFYLIDIFALIAVNVADVVFVVIIVIEQYERGP